jgi:hypothetical protein
VTPIERRNMNAWVDDTVRTAVLATNRKRLLVAGFLTKGRVSFRCFRRSRMASRFLLWPILAAALLPKAIDSRCGEWKRPERVLQVGCRCCSSSGVIGRVMKPMRVAQVIVVASGGGYGMGLAYAREMIHAW